MQNENTVALEPIRSFKLLSIGNSFSDDSLDHFYQAAKAAGAEDIIIGHLLIPGCSLSMHYENAKNNLSNYEYRKITSDNWEIENEKTLKYGLRDEKWDIIITQQVSGLSGVQETYNDDLEGLLDYINKNKTNPSAKIGWHMTWAYQADSDHGDFNRYSNNQKEMYNAITAVVQDKIVHHDKISFIIPTGTAVQNLRSSYLGDNLTRDGFHLSLMTGRYLASLTWLKVITGLSIDDISYVPSNEIDNYRLAAIKEAVNNAVITPFDVTPSTYVDAPIVIQVEGEDEIVAEVVIASSHEDFNEYANYEDVDNEDYYEINPRAEKSENKKLKKALLAIGAGAALVGGVILLFKKRKK